MTIPITHRRPNWLSAPLLALAGAIAGPAHAADALGNEGPDEALTAMRKIQCSTVDGVPVTYGWEGRTYSRVPGEPDRLLFKVEGMNIRQCGPLTVEEGGPGFKLVTREILLYLDPETRTMTRVNMGDAAEADHVFKILMGDEVEPRREFINDNAGLIRYEDLDI